MRDLIRQELVSPNRMPLVQAGIGADVSWAWHGKELLVEQGHPISAPPKNGMRHQRNLIAA